MNTLPQEVKERTKEIKISWKNMGEFSGDVIMPDVTIICYDKEFSK
jgi:hypothetical protein